MTLKAALKKRNMSALELIHRSGLSEQTVYNITSPNKKNRTRLVLKLKRLQR